MNCCPRSKLYRWFYEAAITGPGAGQFCKNEIAFLKGSLKTGKFQNNSKLQLNKHYVVSKRRGSARAGLQVPFLKSRQLRLGSIPRSKFRLGSLRQIKESDIPLTVESASGGKGGKLLPLSQNRYLIFIKYFIKNPFTFIDFAI